jgi:hypothetical protein
MRRLILALLALGLAVPAPAAPAPRSANTRPAAAQPDPFALPGDVVLSAEQKDRFQELKREYAARLAEADARLARLLTPPQRKAFAEAQGKAAAEGKKGMDASDATVAALKLPRREQAALREAFATRARLLTEINQRKVALLHPAQQARIKVHIDVKARIREVRE